MIPIDSIFARRPCDAAITAASIYDRNSVSIIDLKLKPFMYIQYGGKLMPIGTVDSRYVACRYRMRMPQ